MTAPHSRRVEFPGIDAPQLEGLTLDSALGRLSLALLPSLPELGPPPEGVHGRLLRGIAVSGGRVFWISGDGLEIRVRECDGSVSRFGCSPGGTELEMTGLAATPRTLYVSLHAVGSVVAYEISSGQVTSTWSGLDRPGDLAASPHGDVYAATSSSVIELEHDGAVRSIAAAADPHSIAWSQDATGRAALIVAAGRAPVSISTVWLDGAPPGELPVPDGPPHPDGGSVLVRWSDGRLLVGSSALGRAWLWDTTTGSWAGSLPGAPVALLGVGADQCGGWWLGDGTNVRPTGSASWAERGTLRIGPLAIPPDPGGGRRELLRVKLRGALDHVSVRTDVTFGRGDGLVPAGQSDDRAGDHSPDRLLRIPAGSETVKLLVELSGPPAHPDDPEVRHWLEAIELRFDQPGLIDALPAIYRRAGEPGEFLDPYLRLLASCNDDVVDALVDLADQFDPATATDDLDGDRWLDWLASWVDARIDERWPMDRRREVVASSFDRHGRRGTPDAIRHRIALELGIDARIVEPGDLSSVWVLGTDDTELGMTAMLAESPAGGSVLDVSAVVDRSHLIGPGEMGAPLFGDLAHRFHVVVDAASVPDDRFDALLNVVEREKPAHTHAHICRVEPGIQLGLGGRIGHDLVIGPPTAPMAGLDGFGGDAGRPRLGEPFPDPLILA